MTEIEATTPAQHADTREEASPDAMASNGVTVHLPADADAVANGNGAAEAAHSPPSSLSARKKKQQESPGQSPAKPRLKPHRSSMDPETQPLQITYRNLSWSVDVPNPAAAAKGGDAPKTITKQVLHELSGTFHPGRLTAVMGSSGAGKTTLLQQIAGYGSSAGRTSGEILVNGHALSSGLMRDLSGFVHQQDVILESMTVREAVRMAAFLRLPRRMPAAEKDARVAEVLRWLNLARVADNQIGSPEKKGVSGGERRRVSIAMEFVRNPSILFLDEPTSGLDSFTAYSVAHLLRSVARKHNRTIVATIHQPSSEVFELFDDLLLLDQGHTVYHGPASECMAYFHRYLGYTVPPYTNPSDFIFMDILNNAKTEQYAGVKQLQAGQADTDAAPKVLAAGALQAEEGKLPELAADPEDGGKSAAPMPYPSAPATTKTASGEAAAAAESAREQRIIGAWNEPASDGSLPEPRRRMDAAIARALQPEAQTKLPDAQQLQRNTAGFFTQFYFLSLRAFRDVARNPFKLRARIFQACFMGVFIALCYMQVGHGQISVQNRRGVLFFLSTSGFMNATMGTLTIFAAEKEVFMREYASRMYGVSAFFFSKFAMELPMRIIMPIVQALILYWAVGLSNTASQWFILVGTMILLDVTGAGIGTLFASLFPSLPVALAATPMITLPLMLFSGFFLNADSIPVYLDWISYLSPIKYSFIALSKNEFPGLTFDCEEGAPCVFRRGEDVLRQLNFHTQPSLAVNEAALLALAAGFFTLAFLVLWAKARRL